MAKLHEEIRVMKKWCVKMESLIGEYQFQLFHDVIVETEDDVDKFGAANQAYWMMERYWEEWYKNFRKGTIPPTRSYIAGEAFKVFDAADLMNYARRMNGSANEASLSEVETSRDSGAE
jgi:hypothetical protein